MKTNYALRSLIALIVLWATALTASATVLTENFNSGKGDAKYNTGSSPLSSVTSNYNYTDWTANTNVFYGTQFVRLSSSSYNGTITNTSPLLETIPEGTEFTVKVYAIKYGNDKSTLTASYNGSSADVTPTSSQAGSTTYSASHFATSVNATFTKGTTNEISFAATKRIIIDKIEVEFGPAVPSMTVSPGSLSFRANMGETATGDVKLTLSNWKNATVNATITAGADYFSVAAGSDNTYTVTFTAPNTAGEYNGTLTFTADGVNPVTVALTGTAVDPNAALDIVENFNCSKSENTQYGQGIPENTTGFDYTGWSGSNFYSSANFIRLATAKAEGTITNSNAFLENVPEDTEFIVRVWCASYGSDNSSLSVSYNENTSTLTPTVSVTSTNNYSASDFAALDFTFTKGSTSKLTLSAAAGMHVIIDKIEIVIDNTPRITADKSELSFVAYAGEAADAQTITLSLSNLDASTTISPSLVDENNCFTVNKNVDGTYNVTFKAPATAGTYKATLTFSAEGVEGAEAAVVQLTGVSKEKTYSITANPTALTFNATVGTTATAQTSLTLDNVTADKVKYQLSGDNASYFEVAAGTDNTYTVTFTAPATAGNYSATLTFSATIEGVTVTPAEVTLTGKVPTPGIEVSATSLSFGEVHMGTFSAPHQVEVTLTNGMKASDVTCVSDNAWFIVEQASVANDKVTFNVTYNANPETATENGKLTVAGGSATTNVTVSGTSVNPFGQKTVGTDGVTKLNSVDQLVDGMSFYIAAESNGTTYYVNHFDSDNQDTGAALLVTTDQSEAITFTLHVDATNGGYQITCPNTTGTATRTYLVPDEGTDLHLVYKSWVTDNCWTITCDENGFFKLVHSSTTTRTVGYDPTNNYIANFANSTSNYNNIVLYGTGTTVTGMSQPTTVPAQGAQIEHTASNQLSLTLADDATISSVDYTKIWINSIPAAVAATASTFAAVTDRFTFVPTASDFTAEGTYTGGKVTFNAATTDDLLIAGSSVRVMFLDGALTAITGAMPAFGWEFTVSGAATGIDRVEGDNALTYNGRTISNTTGDVIEVYNLSGVLIARSSNGTVDLSRFARGIYLARSGNQVMKISK